MRGSIKFTETNCFWNCVLCAEGIDDVCVVGPPQAQVYMYEAVGAVGDK